MSSRDLTSHIFNETEDNLPNATYYGVTSDNQGRLWLSSNSGLLCYGPVQHSVIRYFPVDGLFGNALKYRGQQRHSRFCLACQFAPPQLHLRSAGRQFGCRMVYPT